MTEAPDPDLRERTFLYSVRAVRIYEHICTEGKSASAVILGEQFLRCATSLGAAVDDAQQTESRGEYAARMDEALKEAREALYWLRLMKDTDTVPSKRIVPIEQNTREIVQLIAHRVGGVRAKSAVRRR